MKKHYDLKNSPKLTISLLKEKYPFQAELVSFQAELVNFIELHLLPLLLPSQALASKQTESVTQYKEGG